MCFVQMLAFDLNKEGDVVASHKRVELQDLEFDHTYTAVVLARHDGEAPIAYPYLLIGLVLTFNLSRIWCCCVLRGDVFHVVS